MTPRTGDDLDDSNEAVSEAEADTAFPLDALFAPDSTHDSAPLGAAPTMAKTEPALSTLDLLDKTREVDHYRLLRELGRGGMGVVYAAQDTKLGRKVAIKVLLSRGHVGLQRRLMREAMALAKLSHPNVIPIYEVREREDVTFLVMEYVDGQTLRTWLDSPRSLDEILETFVSAGRGLIAAHDKGLIHRDFKPDNVMIGADRRVRVMDFGLARASEDGGEGEGEGAGAGEDSSDPADAGALVELAAFTRTGALLGTPAYMSPEQLRGQPAGAASDQFSFCVALFEAVHGQRPFTAKTLDELSKALEAGTIAARPKDSQVPTWLDAILVRGLAPAPGDRFASMEALVAALEAGEAANENLLTKFWDRKIPHVVGAYAAGGAAGIEIFNQISARFGVRAEVGDALLIGAAALMPSIVAVLWIQGEGGRRVWTRGMRLFVAFNVVAAVALAWPFARGPEAASEAVDEVVAATEPNEPEPSEPEPAGEAQTEATAEDSPPAQLPPLAKVEARPPCVLMFPLAGALPEDQRSLRTGILALVEEALSPTTLPALEREWLGEGKARLVELRVPEGQAVPASLMIERMRERGCDQIVHGDIELRDPGRIALDLSVAREGEEPRSQAIEGPLLDAVDEASAWLARTLAPEADTEVSYKRVRDGFTANEAALRLFLRATDSFTIKDQAQLELLDQAVELDSSFAYASYSAGMLAKNLLGNDETLRRFRRALDHRYRFTDLRRVRVEVEYFAFIGSPEQAEGVILAALERDPADIELLTLLARLRLGRSSPEGARAAYERVLEIDPDDINALRGLAHAHQELWRFTDMVAPARRLVELRPEDPQGYVLLGTGLLAAGEVEEARVLLREAYGIAPTNPDIRTSLAGIEISHGDPELGLKLHREALDELRIRAEDSDQARTEYQDLLAQHLGMLALFGRTSEALTLARPEIEWLVEDSTQTVFDRLVRLARLLSFYGNANEAEAGYAVLERIDPGPSESARYTWLALRLGIAISAHDRVECRDLLERFTALADEAPELREAIETDIQPMLILCQEQWEVFIEIYEGLTAAKRMGFIEVGIVWAYDALERYDELEAKIAPLLVLNPNSPHLRYFQARIQRSRGEHEAAKASVSRALELYAKADAHYHFYVKARALAAEYE